MNLICHVCGGNEFTLNEVLWPKLISEWQLSPFDAEQMNLQQGFTCQDCKNNLRSMALAKAFLAAYPEHGTLVDFTASDIAQKLSILEINEAGRLTPILEKLPHHRLIRFPEHDMTRLSFSSGRFDIVLHSDTLEHVPDPVEGLKECKRVLSPEGRCLFTVPTVPGRLTRSRKGMAKSYHGRADIEEEGFLVYTEFGADVWRFPLEAGFSKVTMHCIHYPAGLAIETRI
jgi:SAM-dependent methyltransferase